MKASVLLLTLNEAANLPRCLASLAWCDDIVIVDSGSTDATLEIAKAHGARVLQRAFDGFAGQRNFGIDHGQFLNEWVLHLDADEVLTESFITQLTKLIPAPGIDAYRVPSKTLLFDKWLRYAGMYPTYQVRLGHRDRLRFKQVGHGQREDLPPERIGTFEEPYLHYTFSQGLRKWLEKHLHYADDEAKELVSNRSECLPTNRATGSSTDRRRRLKLAANLLPLTLRPLARFTYIYVVRRGFLDGRAGFAYASMLALYEGMIAILAWEALVSKERRECSLEAFEVDAHKSGTFGLGVAKGEGTQN